MNPNCFKCGDEFNPVRKALGYNTCLACGSPKIQLPIIEVNKSNPVVGTLAELRAANAKGPRTW